MIKNFQNNDFNNVNAYLVIDDNKNAILFDVADKAQKISDYLKNDNLKLLAIFITHSHFDHVLGLKVFQNEHNVPIFIGENDYKNLFDCQKNLSFKRNLDWQLTSNKNIFKISEEEIKTLEKFNIRCLQFGGHTPGTTFYILNDKQIFVGDTFFKNSIGFHNVAIGTNIKRFYESLVWIWKNACK
ncbi:MBL fold metallo-hydrolase [Spiroplasma endosymbiont of Crioceris asparagi]|uniref:MBL fold metallo-hydrolase n=1 Tax=Spiroplasma endosymbiont of Crioceris asparagi TaxID=3066286 RepID=UPI0030D20E89